MSRTVGEILTLQLTNIEEISSNVTSFTFEDPDGGDLPAFSPGSHIVLMLHSCGRVRRNSYTLTGDPDDTARYVISVQKQLNGRGGSRFLHEEARIGDFVKVRVPLNFFPIDRTAKRHLLIAGGIGVTPFLRIAQELDRDDAEFELHCCVRSMDQAPFAQLLRSRYGARVHIHDGAKGLRLNIAALLSDQRIGTHVYVCGSARILNDVARTVENIGFPISCFHYERFRTEVSGEPFSVVLAEQAGRIIQVSSDQTMLEALEDSGVEIDSMCRVGACGKCRATVKHHTGEMVHNDHVLDSAERAEGTCIIPCVSRIRGGQVVMQL